ncbi:MAG: FlgD immunoglobulin-like domain containing protein, partial [Candidatus Krumholzibacteria bacterium]|nr:FlgD immunoglobulin-like domain containing protein [Candidatus Krumholzibacteria bacterium]
KPLLNNITFEWLNDSARIKAVTDVPGDQGGWLRLEMNRSGYDFAAAVEHQAVAYQVYQRVDDAGFALQVEKDGEMPSPSDLSKASREAFQPEQLRRFEGRNFVSTAAGSNQKAGSFPAGIWEIVGNVFATQSDSYSLRVPTVTDSTAQGNAWSVFVVTTHTETPSAWFVSDPDSSYSVDNIAPGAPAGVTAAYASGGVTLAWAPAPEVDFQYYRVYRGTNSGFVVGPENLVAETGNMGWVDPSSDPYGFFYQVTALDHAGNESEAGAPQSVSSVPGAGRSFALHPAAPNPFNPSTTISYEIPVSGHVRLNIYDASGRLVAHLVDEEQGSGEHRATWRGLDKAGQRVGSGVYFYRLDQGGRSRNGRMGLAK